jgi:hypothetical protein
MKRDKIKFKIKVDQTQIADVSLPAEVSHAQNSNGLS